MKRYTMTILSVSGDGNGDIRHWVNVYDTHEDAILATLMGMQAFKEEGVSETIPEEDGEEGLDERKEASDLSYRVFDLVGSAESLPDHLSDGETWFIIKEHKKEG